LTFDKFIIDSVQPFTEVDVLTVLLFPHALT